MEKPWTGKLEVSSPTRPLPPSHRSLPLAGLTFFLYRQTWLFLYHRLLQGAKEVTRLETSGMETPGRRGSWGGGGHELPDKAAAGGWEGGPETDAWLLSLPLLPPTGPVSSGLSVTLPRVAAACSAATTLPARPYFISLEREEQGSKREGDGAKGNLPANPGRLDKPASPSTQAPSTSPGQRPGTLTGWRAGGERRSVVRFGQMRHSRNKDDSDGDDGGAGDARGWG